MESQWLIYLLLMLSICDLDLCCRMGLSTIQKSKSKTKRQHAEAELNQKKQVQVLASGSIGMGGAYSRY